MVGFFYLLAFILDHFKHEEDVMRDSLLLTVDREVCQAHMEDHAAISAKATMPAQLPEQLAAVRREIHLLLKQANYDLGKFQFNTVASAAMKMLNSLEKIPGEAGRDAVVAECFGILLRVLSPITPHITSSCNRPTTSQPVPS